MTRRNITQEALEILRDTPNVRCTAEEIAGELTVTESQAAAALQYLTRQGYANRTGAGLKGSPYRYWVEA